MAIRDRIRELRRVRAADLLPNPRNWRIHPRRQREALQAVLSEIGYADVLLAREMADGRLVLIDGHLRAETTPEALVPVLVLDVTETEADKMLATVDPLASLAEADHAKLTALLAGIETENPELSRLFEQLAGHSSDSDEERVGSEALREQYNILVICADESEQRKLLEQFSAEGLSCRAFVV